MFCYLILIGLFNWSSALKILFVQPNFPIFHSHFGFALDLAKLLADDGHEVHILALIRKNSPQMDIKPLTIYYFEAESEKPYLEILNDLPLINKLKAEKFDVGIAEAFMLTEYSLAVLHFLGIPKTIATHSQPISPVQLYLLGVLSKISSGNRLVSVGSPTLLLSDEERLKMIGTKVGDHRQKQLEERRADIWKHCLNQTVNKIREHITEDILYQQVADEKYEGQTFPGIGEIFKRTRFFLINSQPELDFDQFEIVRKIEKVQFIGAFNLNRIQNPVLNLPIDLNSKKGTILVSFGTNVNTNKAESTNLIEAIREMTKKFPNYMFIWKLSEHCPDKSMNDLKNVIVKDWVQQKEILAHPKTVAFVSHCGMNSVLEGIYNGVPMVCVPFFGDQYYNAESLARQHIGLVIDRKQNKHTVQQQLTVALAKALGQKELLEEDKLKEMNDPEDQIDLEQLKKVGAKLRQKKIEKTISNAMKVIEKELGGN